MKLVKISEVKPNPKNPRIIKDGKFQKLVKSIQEFPDMLNKRPLVVFTDVDNKYVVLGGNMRLKACKEIGLKEIPIIIADEWTEEQKNEFLIKDNVGFGEWDWDSLANEWDAEKLDEWGLDVPDFAVTELEAEEDDFDVPEGGIETDIVLGDLFEIGEHRLLCGDSTCSDTVAKLMNGEKAELLFTSPPYSDMREYNGGKDLSIENLIEFIPTFLPYAEYQVINLGIQRKDNEIFQYWDEYIQKAKECGYKFLSWNVWNRESAKTIAQQSAYFPIAHEWIFVFGDGNKKLNKIKDKAEATLKDKRIDNTCKKTTINSVLTLQPALDKNTTKHPARFPVEFPSEYIQSMTIEKDIVSEPFLGSGTTMVAAHQLKRKCYGMELDTKYCQVIIDRMKKLDPSLVIKKNGVELK
jgi:DNA modification methylase